MRIEATDVRKRFDDVQALDGVTFSVAAGAKVALVGPNGSGKSTLVRGLVGLVRCDGIRLDGRDPFTERAALADRMAYVPQTAPRIGVTAGELVRAIAALRHLDVLEIRRLAGELDLRLDEVDARPLRALSGGMQQKLLIALALAAPVSLLVLDEPTASLDARTRETFFRLCDQRAARATVVLSSHRVDEVDRLTDRVIGLEAGRVAFDSPSGARRVVDCLTGTATHADPPTWGNDPGAVLLAGVRCA
jgi:ABC-2 type transport system ATP-binding protein